MEESFEASHKRRMVLRHLADDDVAQDMMSKLGLGASGKETRILTSLTVESFSWARMSAHAIGSVAAVVSILTKYVDQE